MPNRDLTPFRRGSGPGPFTGADPFASFRREMDRLFDDFFAPGEARSFAAPQAMAELWPSLDVRETDQAYVVTAELPGLDPNEVELNLRDNALVISGEKRSERDDGEGGRRYSERSFGRFERIVPFDAEVDADRVEASASHGVLTITLPKNAQARDKSRRIEIKSKPQDQGQGRAAGGNGGKAGSGAERR